MLIVTAWDDDRVGRLAYDATLDLSIIAPGMAGPKRRTHERKRAEYANVMAESRTLLDPGVPAPAQSIAFFSSPTGRFGDRCIRLNHERFEKLGIEEPDYVKSALYRVAVRGEPLWKDRRKFMDGLPEAVRWAVVYLNRRERRRQRSPLGFISYEPAGILT